MFHFQVHTKAFPEIKIDGHGHRVQKATRATALGGSIQITPIRDAAKRAGMVGKVLQNICIPLQIHTN